VLLALGVALVTGIVSGFLPAWRAARLTPVEALRND
jgi:putative ABC transport system permease protein